MNLISLSNLDHLSNDKNLLISDRRSFDEIDGQEGISKEEAQGP